jgi:hypothetical protein
MDQYWMRHVGNTSQHYLYTIEERKFASIEGQATAKVWQSKIWQRDKNQTTS